MLFSELRCEQNGMKNMHRIYLLKVRFSTRRVEEMISFPVLLLNGDICIWKYFSKFPYQWTSTGIMTYSCYARKQLIAGDIW